MTDFEEFRKEEIKETARYFQFPEEKLANLSGTFTGDAFRAQKYWDAIECRRED